MSGHGVGVGGRQPPGRTFRDVRTLELDLYPES